MKNNEPNSVTKEIIKTLTMFLYADKKLEEKIIKGDNKDE